MGPEGFAEANILATMVLIISFLGVAIQLTIARESALHGNDHEKGSAIIVWFEKIILKASIFFTICGLITCNLISDYLNMNNYTSVLIILLGLPFYFLLSVRRGYFQGNQQFIRFSLTFILETAGRLSFTIIGVLWAINYAPQFIVESVAIGFLFSFILPYAYTRMAISIPKLNSSIQLSTRDLIHFFGIISVYELSQILINNCDVILVKHYFDDYNAGIYASIALIGRMVYFGTWSIVTILFPKVIEKEKRGESHSSLFYGSLFLVAGCGIIITMACFWKGSFLMEVLFGNKYSEASGLLWKYAFSTTVFAAANVFAYYYMSLKNYLPVFITLIAGVVQLFFIILMHDNLSQVIAVQIISMTTLLSIMIVYHLIKSRLIKVDSIILIKPKKLKYVG